MSRKQDKAAKRKAKLKAKRVHEENLRLQLNGRIANAIMDLCADVLPEYVDDSNGLDINGRLVLWQMGMMAWNVAVTGQSEMADNFLAKMRLEDKAKKLIREEIERLIRKKYERYPRICTSVKGVATVVIAGDVKLKVAVGDTFPEMPIPEFDDEPETLSPEQILAKRKELGLSQAKFAAALGVSVKKVSAWEHGKVTPTAEELVKITSLHSEE